MKITQIKCVARPIRSRIRNAVIDFSKMDCSLVAIYTDQVRQGKKVVGYGFNSNGRYSSCSLLQERFIPRLLAADADSLLDAQSIIDPFKVWNVLMQNEKPGGHGQRSVSVGVLDMAIWDIVGKMQGKPLHRVFAERFNHRKQDEDIFVYAAGGYYYPEKELEALQEEMRRYKESGYTHLKMKIGGESLKTDLRRIEAVLAILDSSDKLCIDANGRFTEQQAIEWGRALAQYDLFWYEEPGDPLDYGLMKAVARQYRLPLATGENLFSSIDAKNLLLYGGLRPDRDWLQFDPVLSYGVPEFLRTLHILQSLGWSRRRLIPHGGHQMNVALASGLQLGGVQIYPELFQPFGGFPDGTSIEASKVRVVENELPGLGVEGKGDLADLLKEME